MVGYLVGDGVSGFELDDVIDVDGLLLVEDVLIVSTSVSFSVIVFLLCCCCCLS